MTCPAKCPDFTQWDSKDDEWNREKESPFERVAGSRPTWVKSRTTFVWASVVRLMNAVQRALPITGLQNDWDGEGSPGYAKETLEKAFEFIMRNIGTAAAPPQINPGDSGSIDLYWQDENRYLLINFPPGHDEPSYYGEDRFGSTTGGAIKSTSMGRQVAAWLLEAGR